MPIRPLQLPDPAVVPRVDFSPLVAIGQSLGDARLQKAESEAFGGLVDMAEGGGGGEELMQQQPQQQPQQQRLPRGLRNNNPGNIEDGPLAKSLPGYKGAEPEGRFAVFDTPENGLGAMDALLVSYGRRGLKTARDIATRWAPKSAKDPNNNPEEYAAYIGGGDPDKPIDLSNPEQRKQITLAMARFENGMAPARSANRMPPELARRVRALFEAGTPAARQAARGLVARFLPGGKDNYVKLGEGDTLIDPNSREVIARGSPKRERREKETTEEEIAAREQALIKRGLDPKDPSNRAFMLTGRMPREDQQPLSSTDKKAVLEADELVMINETAIKNLQTAKTLSPKAKEGLLAGQRGYVGSLVGQTAGEDTVKLNNVVTTNALGQLKAIFGAAPTEGERKILLEIQGSVNQTDTVRQDIYDRAIEMANARLKLNKARADELRGGTFYKPKPEQADKTGKGDRQPIPDEAVAELRANAKNPVYRASFDKHFGAGAAERVLRAAR